MADNKPTAQEAVEAYNALIDYCYGMRCCIDCVIQDRCDHFIMGEPGDWPKIDWPDIKEATPDA